MARTFATVEFGSSKIIVGVDTSKSNGLSIPYIVCKRYSGIKNGKFLRLSELSSVLETAVTEIEELSKQQITGAHVGVPGCFLRILATEGSKYIKTSHVTREDLDSIKKKLAPRTDANWQLIDIKPIYFFDDRDELFVGEPVGLRTHNLTACYSYFFVSKYFVDIMSSVFKEVHMSIDAFIPEVTSQAAYFLNRNQRDATALLIDVGYMHTDISVVYGDGILVHSTVQGGGYNITKEIQNTFGVDAGTAEKIKRSHIFGIGVSHGQKSYVKASDGKMSSFDAYLVSSVIEESTKKVADAILAKLRKYSKYVNKNTPIYLIGGGFAINGITYYLSNYFGRRVQVLHNKEQSNFPPVYDTSLALLDNANLSGYDLKNRGGITSSVKEKLKVIFFPEDEAKRNKHF